jgi:hypothetical protein
MKFLMLISLAILPGCSSSGEHPDVHTPGKADTLQLQTSSAAGTRVDGTAVEATTTDTLSP